MLFIWKMTRTVNLLCQRYQVYSHVASEARNEKVQSYVASQTRNITI